MLPQKWLAAPSRIQVLGGAFFILISELGKSTASFIYVSWIDRIDMEKSIFSATSPKFVGAFLIIIISTTLLIGLSERGRSLTQEEEILSGVFTLLCILPAPLAIIGANLAQKNKSRVALQKNEDNHTE